MVSLSPDGSRTTHLLRAVMLAIIGLSLFGVGVGTAQQAPLEADNTVTHVRVTADGDATWTVQIRIGLDTDEQVAEFETFQDEFRRNTSRYLDPFRQRIQTTVTNAANATGRQMTATNFTASTSIQEVPRRWGVVTFRFTWNSFAERQDGTLIVGDVFQGGFFLSASDSLEITVVEGFEVAAVEPTPDEREGRLSIWLGREDFTDEHPRIVFSGVEQTPQTATSTTPATSTPAGGDRSLDGSVGRGLLFGGVLLVGLAVIGTYALWRRRGGVIGGDPTGSEVPDSASQSRTEPHKVGAADGEILTDAERVQQLLESEGGRMRQAAIANELDWSASKTSRVIGELVEAGTVEKLQLGRENVIDLPDDS